MKVFKFFNWVSIGHQSVLFEKDLCDKDKKHEILIIKEIKFLMKTNCLSPINIS